MARAIVRKVVVLRQCGLMMTRQGTAVVLRLYTTVVLECCEAAAAERRGGYTPIRSRVGAREQWQ
jgi:hypothetical protein